ncbi:hypothetical protein Tco_0128189 [Tanacetum coccineum]
MDKGKVQTSRADDKGFFEVKRNKSGGNNGGNKNFKPYSLKLIKHVYRPKVKQSAERTSTSAKMTTPVDTNKASTSRKKEVITANDLERINDLERQMLDGKLFLVDDDGKLLKKFDYPVNADSKDKVEQVDNETVIFMSSKQLGSGSGYGIWSLLKTMARIAKVGNFDDNDPHMMLICMISCNLYL